MNNDISPDDWAAVLSGIADEETLARYREALESQDKEVATTSVQSLQESSNSLLQSAISAVQKKNKKEKSE